MAISPLVKLASCGICVVALGCRANSTAHLIAQLHDTDPKVRQTAARALAEPHDVPAAVNALTRAVGDPAYEVREEAAQSLGRIGQEAKSSLPALEAALKDQHSSVRNTAALAIHSIDAQQRSYVPVLCAALQAGDGPVFLEVARMRPAAEWAVSTLTSLLSHREPSIRALAAQTLGGIGAPAASAMPSLKRLVRDEHPAVHKAARNAMDRITPMSSAPTDTAKSTR